MASRSDLLKYIENTAGNATLQNFIEDWEPVGNLGWDDLSKAELVTLEGNKVVLTDKGREYLNAQR